MVFDINKEDNIKKGKEYFKNYSLPTETRADPENNEFFCVIQETVNGKPLTNWNIRENPDLRNQLDEIVRLNHKLYSQEKKSLDFVGMPGFSSWIKRQLGKILLRKSEFEVSNILIDPNNKLKIVDFEFFDFADNVSFRKKVSNLFGSITNRVLMKHYTGLDINKAI